MFLLQRFDLVYLFVRTRVLAAVRSQRHWDRAVLRTERHFVNVIDRKNTSCNPSHMMALLGFANFYKVKPLLLQSSFCLVLCGSSLDNTSSTWLSGGLPIEIFNRSNPFLCSSCCVCVTERLDRRAFQFGAVARCSDAYSHVTK